MSYFSLLNQKFLLMTILYCYILVSFLFFFIDNNEAFAEDSELVNSIIERGKSLYNEGNYTEAIKYFDGVLAIDPENVDALYQKGLTLDNIDFDSTTDHKEGSVSLTNDSLSVMKSENKSNIPDIEKDLLSTGIQGEVNINKNETNNDVTITTSDNIISKSLNISKSDLNNRTIDLKPKTFNVTVVSEVVSIHKYVNFIPEEIVIDTGSTVIWTNNDSSIIRIISDNQGSDNIGPIFDSDYMEQNDTFSFTFRDPGRFYYHDENSNARGVVFVKQNLVNSQTDNDNGDNMVKDILNNKTNNTDHNNTKVDQNNNNMNNNEIVQNQTVKESKNNILDNTFNNNTSIPTDIFDNNDLTDIKEESFMETNELKDQKMADVAKDSYSSSVFSSNPSEFESTDSLEKIQDLERVGENKSSILKNKIIDISFPQDDIKNMTFIEKCTQNAISFNNPEDIAINPVNNLVYVTDAYNYRIQTFTPEGKFVSSWGKQPSLFNPSSEDFSELDGITINPITGDVYINQFDEITKFTKDGKFLSSWGKNGDIPYNFSGIYGMASDINGTIYVIDADSQNTTIKKFTPDGEYISGWKMNETKLDFDEARTIAISPINGEIFIGATNHNIFKFTPNGEYISKFNLDNNESDIQEIKSIAISPFTGFLHVVDSGYSNENSTIYRYTPNGEYISSWNFNNRNGTGNHIIESVAISPINDEIYGTDSSYNSSKVFKLTPDGEYILSWGKYGSEIPNPNQCAMSYMSDFNSSLNITEVVAEPINKILFNTTIPDPSSISPDKIINKIFTVQFSKGFKDVMNNTTAINMSKLSSIIHDDSSLSDYSFMSYSPFPGNNRSLGFLMYLLDPIENKPVGHILDPNTGEIIKKFDVNQSDYEYFMIDTNVTDQLSAISSFQPISINDIVQSNDTNSKPLMITPVVMGSSIVYMIVTFNDEIVEFDMNDLSTKNNIAHVELGLDNFIVNATLPLDKLVSIISDPSSLGMIGGGGISGGAASMFGN